MLKRNHKFNRDSFNTFYSRLKPLHTEHFILRYEKTSTWSDHKVSIVVSKKVEKTAVKRNSSKRRLYYAVKNLNKTVSNPYKLIVVVKKNIQQLETHEIQQELQRFLK